jgi:hypothetical protein
LARDTNCRSSGQGNRDSARFCREREGTEMTCSTCDSTLALDDKFCATCGSPVATDDTVVPSQRQPAIIDHVRSAVGSRTSPAPLKPAQGPAGGPETADQGMPPGQVIRRLPDSSVRCGIDEVLWRQYQVLKMRGLAKSSGYLYVTDSRVVFYAYSNGFLLQKPSTMVRETKIAEITGINSYVSRRLSLALLGASVALGLFGIVNVFTLGGIPFALLLWLVSAIFFAALLAGHGRLGTTVISIHSRCGVTPVNIGGGQSVGAILGLILHPVRFIIGGTTAAHLATYGLPGKEANETVTDLGALIQDLQTRGDMAAPYWQVPLPGPSLERGVAVQ